MVKAQTRIGDNSDPYAYAEDDYPGKILYGELLRRHDNWYWTRIMNLALGVNWFDGGFEADRIACRDHVTRTTEMEKTMRITPHYALAA